MWEDALCGPARSDTAQAGLLAGAFRLLRVASAGVAVSRVPLGGEASSSNFSMVKSRADLQAAKVRFLRLSGLVCAAGLPATQFEGEDMTEGGGGLWNHIICSFKNRESRARPGLDCGLATSIVDRVEIQEPDGHVWVHGDNTVLQRAGSGPFKQPFNVGKLYI